MMIARLSSLAAALALASALPAFAQAPAVPFAAPADLAALVAKAKAEHKPGQLTIEPMLVLAPYHFQVEYRTDPTPVAVHDVEAELIEVIGGSGTFVTGGEMTGATRPNATNQAGTGITGGVTHKLVKGSYIFVPQGVPHWFNSVDGTLVILSVHMPRTTP